MAPAAIAPRNALVTGAGKRLGRAMAIALADAGFNVAVHFNTSRQEAESVARDCEARGVISGTVKADLGVESDLARLVDDAAARIGPLSLLVNSASLFEDDDIDTSTRASWDAHMNVNLRAPFVLTERFAKQAPAGVDNLVVNMIDQRVLKLTPQFMSYTLSKSALLTLTKTTAQALGPRGVRVNAIAPGPTMKNARQNDDDFAAQCAATVTGRGATPADIAAALHYLVSARSVTGQMIAVDGGQHLAWRTPDVLVKE